MANTQKVINNIKAVNFKPLSDELSEEDRSKIKYYATGPIGQLLPDTVTKILKQKQIIIVLSPFILAFMAVALVLIFHIKINLFMIIGFGILISFLIRVAFINAHDTITDIRDENFNDANQSLKGVSWNSQMLLIGEEVNDQVITATQKELAHELIHPITLNHFRIDDIFDIGEFHSLYISSLTDDDDDDNNPSYDFRYSRLASNITAPEFRIEKRIFRNFQPMRVRRELSGIKHFGLKYTITVNRMSSDEQIADVKNYLRNPEVASTLLLLYEAYPNLLDIYVSHDHIILNWDDPIYTATDTANQVDRNISQELKSITKATLIADRLFSKTS